MTYQEKLELARLDSDAAIEYARRPGIRIGFANGIAGYTATDASERRPVYGTLTIEAIDDLLDQLELARAHIIHERPTD